MKIDITDYLTYPLPQNDLRSFNLGCTLMDRMAFHYDFAIIVRVSYLN